MIFTYHATCNDPFLTICVPTIVGREKSFGSLISELKSQAIGKDVEIISARDNKEVSIGFKRNVLLEKAEGRYVVMIDDDDMVSSDFIESIETAIVVFSPDCVTFQISCEGTDGKTANVSNKYVDWADNKDGFDYVRTPYHKTPILTGIAREIGFKDLRFGEDYDFSRRLKQSGKINTDINIPKVLYHYRFKYEDPQTKYGFVKKNK